MAVCLPNHTGKRDEHIFCPSGGVNNTQMTLSDIWIQLSAILAILQSREINECLPAAAPHRTPPLHFQFPPTKNFPSAWTLTSCLEEAAPRPCRKKWGLRQSCPAFVLTTSEQGQGRAPTCDRCIVATYAERHELFSASSQPI